MNKELIEQMLEAHGNKTEDEMIVELTISMLENNPDAMKNLLTKARMEKGLPEATDEDIADMLKHKDEMRRLAKEGKLPNNDS